MASGLASFNARRNVRAPAITVSTIQGSSIGTASITTTTLTGSTISFSTLSGSTLTASTLTGNTLSLSTLTVSSINSRALNATSSITTSSITTSSIITAPGYNSNISNVLYTSLADSGQTAASFTTTGLPPTAPSGSVISGSYRLTAGASAGAATMRLSSFTYTAGTTYNFTFTGVQGSTDLALSVRQYNTLGTGNTTISADTYLFGTTTTTISGSFTPNLYAPSYSGAIVFYVQALSVNQYVNFTSFSMTMGGMNVGIGTSNPNGTLQIGHCNTSGGVSDGTVVVGTNNGSSSRQFKMGYDSSSTYNFVLGDYGHIGAINTWVKQLQIAYAAPANSLYINSSGNVGIGTTDPAQTLHVYGTNPYFYLGATASNYNVAQFSFNTISSGSTSNYVSLQIYNSPPTLCFNGLGYVGIGTTNPTTTLCIGSGCNQSGNVPGISMTSDATINRAFTVGQGTAGTNNVILAWNYNATVANAYAHLSCYSGNNPLAFQIGGGNIGIGLTNPTNRLDTFDGVARSGTHATGRSLYATFNGAEYSNGIAEFRHTNGTQGVGIGYAGLYACGSNTDQEFHIIAKGTGLINMRSPMRLTGPGDNCMTYYGPNTTWSSYLVVGAGTDKAGASTAQVISTNGNLHLDAGNGNVIYYGYYSTTRASSNSHQFYGNIFINNSSYMSFGSTTYLFPIYIPYGRSYSWTLLWWYGHSAQSYHGAYGTWPVSIWTDGMLVTSQWYGTVSDRRIKKNIQPVGSMLETINKIEIMSFDFIDSANNKRDECGIIAQQIETVFPNAIDTSTGVIPCYLKLATSQYLVEDDIHILFDYDHTDTQQQFKVGDKIKIHAGQKTDTIDKDKGSHHVIVKSIIDGGFTTEKWKDYEADDGVFVYGKEVDDFRNVDKEQLGVLALKGVQELSSMITVIQQENIELKSQVTTLSANYASLLARLEALEAR